ncbi:MAG: hypothetical protein ACREFX_06990, partial [Opitutaceae bacterium]
AVASTWEDEWRSSWRGVMGMRKRRNSPCYYLGEETKRMKAGPQRLPASSHAAIVFVRVRELRLEVLLAGGTRHVVRYPEQWRVSPESGRVLLYAGRGRPAVQVDPGEVVGLNALPVDNPP